MDRWGKRFLPSGKKISPFLLRQGYEGQGGRNDRGEVEMMRGSGNYGISVISGQGVRYKV
jgi:hypothetical protein